MLVGRFADSVADFLSGAIFVTFGIGVIWLCTGMFQMQDVRLIHLKF